MGVRGAISQKPPLEIFYNVPYIKEFRISAYVEWPDSMEITFDVLQDCEGLLMTDLLWDKFLKCN